MGGEVLASILVPLGMCGLVFGIVYIRNRENMALIDKGINPRQANNRPRPYSNLKYGLLLCGSGLGLLIAFLVDQFLISHVAVTPGGQTYSREFPQIYFALIGMFGGLGLIISYRIEKKEWLDKEQSEAKNETRNIPL